MSELPIKAIIEAAIFAAEDPLSIDKLLSLFAEQQRPEKALLTKALQALTEDYADKGVELIKVASGYRFQARADYAPWLQRLWERKPPRYSLAVLETLALIAYKQPLTRGEIEAVRGVAVSSNIVKTLLDRQWIKVVGHREVPGRPALLATTRQFLDYFNLGALTELPPLSELMDLEAVGEQLGDQLSIRLPGQEQQFEDDATHALGEESDQDDAMAALAEQVLESVSEDDALHSEHELKVEVNENTLSQDVDEVIMVEAAKPEEMKKGGVVHSILEKDSATHAQPQPATDILEEELEVVV